MSFHSKFCYREISQLVFTIEKFRLSGIELYKSRKNISSHIMNELFEQQNILYNHRLQTYLQQDQLALFIIV